MIFFFFFVPNWVYFGQGEDFKLTTELSEKSAVFPQPSNQKRLKWSYTAYVNKRSFTFKIKLSLCLSGNQDLTLYEGDSNF